MNISFASVDQLNEHEREDNSRLRLTRVGKAIWVIVFLRHRIEIDINVSQADSEIEWKKQLSNLSHFLFLC